MTRLQSSTWVGPCKVLGFAALLATILASACQESNHARTLELVKMYTNSAVVNGSCVSIFISRQEAVEKLLPELHHLPELVSLELNNVRLDTTDIEAITKCHVTQLAISFCQVEDESLRVLTKLKNLRSLVLIDCGLTDEKVSWIREFHDLETLNLSLNPLAGTGFKSLQDCTKLKRLILNGTQLSSDSISFLLPFTHLEHLSLGETAVTSRGIEGLAPLIWLNEIGAPDGVMTVEAAERFRNRRLAAIQAAKAAGDEVPPEDWVPFSMTERMPHEGAWSAADFSILQDLIARSAQRAGQVELHLDGWKGEKISPVSIGFPGDAEDGVSSRQIAWQYVKGANQKAEFVLTMGHFSGVMGSIPVLAEPSRKVYPQYGNFGDEERLTLRVGTQDATIEIVTADRLYSANQVESVTLHSTLSVRGIWDADLENTFIHKYQNAPNGKRPESGTTLLYRVHMITAKHVSTEAQHEILTQFLAALARAMKWSSTP